MGNESGKSIVTLLIMTILIIIGAILIINYANKLVEETKIQDLRTNMLLIQAEAKKGVEEVCFQTVNLDENKEEDLAKINEIKNEFLKGIIIANSPTEVQEAIKNVPDVNFEENCYYLDEATLTEMGIKDIDSNKVGYFIVKYNFSNADVEVINTNGYNGNYELTKMNQSSVEGQS